MFKFKNGSIILFIVTIFNFLMVLLGIILHYLNINFSSKIVHSLFPIIYLYSARVVPIVSIGIIIITMIVTMKCFINGKMMVFIIVINLLTYILIGIFLVILAMGFTGFKNLILQLIGLYP